MTPDDALDVLVEACYQLPRDDRRTAAVDTLRAWARDIRTNPVRVAARDDGRLPAPEVRWSPGDGRLYVFVEDGRGGVPGWVAVWNEATAGIPMGVWGQREPADAVPLVVPS